MLSARRFILAAVPRVFAMRPRLGYEFSEAFLCWPPNDRCEPGAYLKPSKTDVQFVVSVEVDAGIHSDALTRGRTRLAEVHDLRRDIVNVGKALQRGPVLPSIVCCIVATRLRTATSQ